MVPKPLAISGVHEKVIELLSKEKAGKISDKGVYNNIYI